MDYESGVLIAFCLWVYNSAMAVALVNSQLNKNLKKIGIRVGWLDGNPKPMTPADQKITFIKVTIKVAAFVFLGLISLLLSWVLVALYVVMMTWKFAKDSGVPEAVKNYRWVMRNKNMSRDEVIAEFMKLQGLPSENFDTYKQELLNDLLLRGLSIEEY